MRMKKAMLLAGVLVAGLLAGATAFAAEPEEAAAGGLTPEAAEAAQSPMLEYADVPALERSVGFPVYYLPGNLLPLYAPAAHLYSIGRYVSDVRFVGQADDSVITVRTALVERVGTDDISGFHGEWTRRSAGDVKGTQVYTARTENGTRVVRWSAGRFAFAVMLAGIDDAAFENMLKNFVSVADRFAQKYRNFRLNVKQAVTETAEENALNAEKQAASEAPAENAPSAAA